MAKQTVLVFHVFLMRKFAAFQAVISARDTLIAVMIAPFSLHG